jgi:hypothetical protein
MLNAKCKIKENFRLDGGNFPFLFKNYSYLTSLEERTLTLPQANINLPKAILTRAQARH